MPKELGTKVSESKELGDNVVITRTIKDDAVIARTIAANAVLSGHIGSGAVHAGIIYEKHGTNYSCAALTTTIDHDLGVTPFFVGVTPLGSAQVYRGAVNASQLVINVSESGASFDYAVLG